MFQAEKIACAKGLWLERAQRVGGATEALMWLRKSECGVVTGGEMIKVGRSQSTLERPTLGSSSFFVALATWQSSAQCRRL